MIERHRIARHLGIVAIWLLSAAAVAGSVALSGCDKIKNPLGGGEDVTLSIQTPATSIPPGSSLSVTVTATEKGAAVKDGTVVTFKVDALGSISPVAATTVAGRANATFTAGAQVGSAKITASTAGAKKDVTVTIAAGAPPPPVATGDEFPYGIENIAWDNRGTNMRVGDWPVTAKISSAYHSGETLRIYNNCTEKWPHVQKEGWSKPSVGNYWLIGKINGKWHAATVDWAGIGKSGMNDLFLNGNSGMYSDLIDWRPAKGEEAFVMMSTHARAYVDNNNKQRTQIVRITMNP